MCEVVETFMYKATLHFLEINHKVLWDNESQLHSFLKTVLVSNDYHYTKSSVLWSDHLNCFSVSNSPIVCMVLVLDSWTYCFEEQAQQSNIHKTVLSSLYDWTMYINKNKVTPGIPLPLPLIQWSHVRHTLRGRCWAVGPASQSNISNCLVLILHRQLGNYLLSIGESYGPTAQHSQDSI